MPTRCNTTVYETEIKEMTQTMFQVKIKSMFDFIDVFGHHEVPITVTPNTSVGDFIKMLLKTYGEKLEEKMIDPKTGDIYEHLEILQNGRNIRFLQGHSTTLNDGDDVTIFVPIGGG
jgi:molybdopterin synthase sulfur carrier subunit